jgi:hypothetical protein
MLFAALLTAASVVGTPAAESVRLERRGPYLIVSSVYLNGEGPFRFVLDTGAQSSAIRVGVAERLGIRPEARVEQVTMAGAAWVPTGRARAIAVRTESGGSVAGADMEVLLGGIEAVLKADRRADGVLGHDFLLGRNYLLDYAAGRLVFDPVPPRPLGERLPFRIHEGRILLEAEVAGKKRGLVLDSGAPALILFDVPILARGRASFTTNVGTVGAAMAEEIVTIGRLAVVRLPAMSIRCGERCRPSDGVLPAAAFRRIYVNATWGYIGLYP